MSARVHYDEFMNGKDQYIPLWLRDRGETREFSTRDTYLLVLHNLSIAVVFAEKIIH